MIRIGVLAGLLGLGMLHQARADQDIPAALFGPKPVETIVSLGMSHDTVPPSPMQVRCYYYPGFMTKEIDIAEEGDDQISFIDFGKGGKRPVCQRANQAAEMIVDQDTAAYFLGAINGYAFTEAADGMNGGEELEIIDPASGRTIATPVIVLAAAKRATMKTLPGGLVFSFLGQFTADCSVAVGRSQGSACAAAIARHIGVAVPLADCLKLYAAGTLADVKRQCGAGSAAAACAVKTKADDAADPTVVDYPVVMTLSGQLASAKTSGPAEACDMSE